MVSIEPTNIFSIAIIGIYFFCISFAWMLPLYLILKKYVLALQFVIPVSLSIQILFGYVFYSFEKSVFYFIFYALLMLILNLWSIRKIGLKIIIDKVKNLWLRLTWVKVGIALYFLLLILFSRFYDSFSTVAPGNNDTLNHILFLKDIRAVGYIAVSYYAPGFHLLVLPLTKLLPYSELYRFVGPVIGLVTVVAVYLLLIPAFRSKYSKYVLLAFLCMPLFNQLTLQTIGFFSSSLTFIFMAAFLMLLGFSNNKLLPHRYGMAIIMTMALAVTVPYFFVQYSIALLVLLLIALVIRKMFDRAFIVRLAWMTVLGLCGVVTGYFHVMLQTSIHSAPYFPVIGAVEQIQSLHQSDVTAGSEMISNQVDQLQPAVTTVYNAVLPLLSAGVDIARVKDVRSFDSILSAGAYVWIGASLALLVISILKRMRSLMVLSVLSLAYGLFTQTGMFELTMYKGRSGWYLLFLSVLGSTFLYDRLTFRFRKEYLLSFLTVASLAVYFYPPIYYRPYFIESFEFLKGYSKDDSLSIIYSSTPELVLVHDKLSIMPLSQDMFSFGIHHGSIVVLNKAHRRIDPVLSQQVLISDKGGVLFAVAEEEKISKLDKISTQYFELGGCQSNLVIYETEQTIICRHFN